MLYFFDFTYGGDLIEDEIGGEHDTFALAREEALVCLATLMAENVIKASFRSFGVRVRDPTGLSVFKASMTLSEHWAT